MRGGRLAHELAHCLRVGRFVPECCKSAIPGDTAVKTLTQGLMQSPSRRITPCHSGLFGAPLGGHSGDLCLRRGHLASARSRIAYIRGSAAAVFEHLLTISCRLQSIVRAQFPVCTAQL